MSSPYTETLTHFPETDIAIVTGKARISSDDWTSLALDLWQSVTTSYSVRKPMDENLKVWNALYELETGIKDFPFVNSSNVVVPIVHTKLDALLAQCVAKTLVPDFYVVSGFTEKAAEVAYDVQRYYNAEFRRTRGTLPTWFENHVTWLHLALRDGTAFMETLWRRKTRLAKIAAREPHLDDEGMPQFDETGELIHRIGYHNKKIVEYDDVYMRPVWLRDFMFIPSESTSIEEAAGVCRAEWLYESDLNAMINDDLLDAEWVERALDYDPAGVSDVASDRQGVYDKTMGNQIDIGMGQGVLGSKFFKNRGPLKCWRFHTRQYDMNGDGIPEENVFWIHEISQYMLGWCPAEYLAPDRPFTKLCPFPRPDRAYGYSLPELLAGLEAEAKKWHNDRNDYADMALNPPLLINGNLEIHDKEMEWGPGKRWEVADVDNSVKQLQIKDVPIATFQEEALLNSYADQLSGMNQTLVGGQSSGRRTAQEIKTQASSSGTRGDLIAMLFRIASRQVIEKVHNLKLQYMDEDPQGTRLGISREVLSQDLKIDVAGTSDPLDVESHFQEVLGMYNLLRQDPDIANDPMRTFSLRQSLLKAARWDNIEAINGTEQEAQQAQQKMHQQREEQMQLQKQHAQSEIAEKNAKAAKDQSDAKGSAIDAIKEAQTPPEQPQQPQPQSPQGIA